MCPPRNVLVFLLQTLTKMNKNRCLDGPKRSAVNEFHRSHPIEILVACRPENYVIYMLQPDCEISRFVKCLKISVNS